LLAPESDCDRLVNGAGNLRFGHAVAATGQQLANGIGRPDFVRFLGDVLIAAAGPVVCHKRKRTMRPSDRLLQDVVDFLDGLARRDAFVSI
jgi:hypothetical protein